MATISYIVSGSYPPFSVELREDSETGPIIDTMVASSADTIYSFTGVPDSGDFFVVSYDNGFGSSGAATTLTTTTTSTTTTTTTLPPTTTTTTTTLPPTTTTTTTTLPPTTTTTTTTLPPTTTTTTTTLPPTTTTTTLPPTTTTTTLPPTTTTTTTTLPPTTTTTTTTLPPTTTTTTTLPPTTTTTTTLPDEPVVFFAVNAPSIISATQVTNNGLAGITYYTSGETLQMYWTTDSADTQAGTTGLPLTSDVAFTINMGGDAEVTYEMGNNSANISGLDPAGTDLTGFNSYIIDNAASEGYLEFKIHNTATPTQKNFQIDIGINVSEPYELGLVADASDSEYDLKSVGLFTNGYETFTSTSMSITGKFN